MASIPSSLHNRERKPAQLVQPSLPKDVAGLDSEHSTMYCFLSLIQSCGVEIMPVTSEAARELLGRGASGHVNQSVIDITTSLAFKHPNIDGRKKLAVQELLRAEMLEVAILRHPKIQQHPSIIELEGVAWEIDSFHSTILPILVYRKSELGTLGGYIEANIGKLSLNRRLRLCFNVASALATLHSCNVIHGDIKPENAVVFSEEKDEVIAKLIDFGYSCYGTEDEDEVQIGGTPLWSSPEHTGGKISVHSAKKMDIYSFGLVCCWILFFDTISIDGSVKLRAGQLSTSDHSRRHAFAFIEQLKSLESPEEAISDIISRDPTITEQQSSLLQRLLTQVLSKKPSDRPHDWNQLMPLIRKVQGSEPEEIARVNEDYIKIAINACEFDVAKSMADLDIADFRIRKLLARTLEETMNQSRCSKCSTNAALQKAFCQKLGLGEPRDEASSDASLLKGGLGSNALSHYMSRFQNAKHEGLSPRMRKLVGGYSLDLPSTYQNHGCLGEAVSEYEREIEDRQRVIPADHPSLLRLKYSLVPMYEDLHLWRRAADLYAQILEARRNSIGQNAPTALICEVGIASCLAEQGELAQSEQILEQTLRKFKDSVGEDHKSAIATMGYLASVYSKQGRLEEATKVLTRQWQNSMQVNGEHHLSTLSILLNRAQNAFSIGKWEEAENLTLQAIDMQRKALGSDNREVLTGLHSLCRTYIERDKFDLALRIQEEEMKIYKRSGHQEGLGAVLSRDNLGLILYGQEKLAEAAEIQLDTATALEKLQGEDHPHTLSVWSDLAKTYLRQMRLKEAREVQERVVRLVESAPELTQPYAPGLVVGLANIYFKLGRLDDAETAFQKAVELANVVFGSRHPWTLAIRASIANVYKQKHRFDDAREIEEKAVELMETELGSSHPKRLTCMRNLSITYQFLADFETAAKLQEEITKLRSSSASPGEIMKDRLNLSNILFRQEKYGEARMVQEEISSSLETMNGPGHEDTLNSRSHLATTYQALGLLNDSERILREDLPRHIDLYSEYHFLTQQSRSELAKTLSLQDRWREAEQEYKTLLEVSMSMKLPNSRMASKARLGIALARYKQQDYKGATSMLDEFRLSIKETGTSPDKELAEEAETIMLLILAARIGPKLLSELEKLEEIVSKGKKRDETLEKE